jgi:hypothetical protein
MVADMFSHTSIVLLIRGRAGHVVAERPRLRDRLAARLLAHRLDLALADGVSPETNAALALRAQRLTEPDRRWSTAGALRRIVRDARRDRRARLGRVSPNWRAVKAASRALSDLADTLDDPGPVAAAGVALARLLLTDGTGPLYRRGSGELLSVRAAQAAQQLRPWAA